MFLPFKNSVWKGSWKCKWTEKSVRAMLSFSVQLSVSLWIHCCVAACCSELFAAALWVDSYKWTFSLWETLYCVDHLHCSLLFPASPSLMRWCSCNLTQFTVCRCCPLNIFLDSLTLTNDFCPSRHENLLLASHTICCVHSLCCRACCLCFHSAGRLTLAPVPPWVTAASDMTCQQLHSYPNTLYSQKSLIFTSPPDWPPVWSPQPAHQASPCSSPANHSLSDTHLPSPSCRMSNEFQPRGTPFSQTLVFLSRLV